VGWRDPITDEQRLDVDSYQNIVPVQRMALQDMSTELERIRQRLEDWSARPGLLVVTSDEQEARGQDRLLIDQGYAPKRIKTERFGPSGG
jgi:hypothetical protein